jgi:4-hydroxy-tetrahydrodipicolinate reductase
VALVGAGKMGSAAFGAIAPADDLEVVAVVSREQRWVPAACTRVPRIDELDPAAVDVVLDLSATEVARGTLAWVARHGRDAVVGTSGLTQKDLEQARAAAGSSRILVVPNFSIGAVLCQRFAVAAAPYFSGVEVIELHHDHKRDAPSGTSIAVARAIAAARGAAGLGDPSDPTETTLYDGARGGNVEGGVRVHSVRLPGLLAHQEVHFGGPGEGLVLRHDTYDRVSFMGGILLALRGIDRVKGVQVGLEHVLDV